MNEVKRVFISHHHDDAPELSLLKDKLAPMGFKCFLAHEDITPGEHDLDCIEKGIHQCDVFLYISSEAANNSVICQQEIGMAKALKKVIITAMTKENPPKGFIARNQAIRYRSIDDDFINNVYIELSKKYLLNNELQKHLDILGCKGFSRNEESNTIHLLDGNWNDYNFYTTFGIRVNGQDIWQIKIGRIGQKPKECTHDYLFNRFTHIHWPFFSRVDIDYEATSLTPGQITSLKYLFNDTEILSSDDLEIVSREPVYQKSLFR